MGDRAEIGCGLINHNNILQRPFLRSDNQFPQPGKQPIFRNVGGQPGCVFGALLDNHPRRTFLPNSAHKQRERNDVIQSPHLEESRLRRYPLAFLLLLLSVLQLLLFHDLSAHDSLRVQQGRYDLFDDVGHRTVCWRVWLYDCAVYSDLPEAGDQIMEEPTVRVFQHLLHHRDLLLYIYSPNIVFFINGFDIHSFIGGRVIILYV